MREEQPARKVEDLRLAVELSLEEAEVVKGGCSNNLVIDPYRSRQTQVNTRSLIPYIEQDN